MQIPSASFIELAVDQLKQADEAQLADQVKELTSADIGNTEKTFEAGYNLGLQTARVIIETSPAVQESDIKADDIL